MLLTATLLNGCKSSERKLSGLWEVSSFALDNKAPLVITEIRNDERCGQVKKQIIITIYNAYIAFSRDQQYHLSYSYTSAIAIENENDLCRPYKATLKNSVIETGFWTLLDKKTLYLQPIDRDPYQCSIIKLNSKQLHIDCPREITLSVPKRYGSRKIKISSFQIEAKRIGK